MNSNSNALTTFNYLSNTIRVVEIDNQPWFVAADVCRILDLPTEKGVFMYLKRLNTDEKQAVTPNLVGGRGLSISTISESGLYKLIMRSDKPEARKFQDWVTREVLPAIRKDGAYIMGEEKVRTGEMDEDELVLRAVAILQKKVERLREEKAAAEAKVEQLTGPALVGQITESRSRKLQLVVDMLPFVNKSMVSGRLMQLGYIDRKKSDPDKYYVLSPYRNSHFEVRTTVVNGKGRDVLHVCDKGYELLIKLYMTGKLVMKKGHGDAYKRFGSREIRGLLGLI